MKITAVTNPPRNPKPQHSYADLFRVLVEAGGWVAINCSDVAGKSVAANQTTLHQAANKRGLEIETQSQDHLIYLRLSRPEVSV